MAPAPIWSAQIAEDAASRTVRLSGELDLAAADELQRLLITELDTPNVETVTADLTAVTFLDSAALGALIRAYQHAVDTGQSFFARNSGPAVARILIMTGVDRFLDPQSSGQSHDGREDV